MKFLDNKKGNFILDIMVILIIGFIFGIVFLVASKIHTSVSAKMLSSPSMQDSYTQDIINKNQGDNGKLLDGIFAFFILGLYIGLLLSAFFIKVHPIFFFISLFLLIVVVVIVLIFSNAWTTISNDAQFSDVKSNFPMTSFIMDNILIYSVVFAMLVAIIQFSRGTS
jgi:tetrahydromethanopterin S-methyltransferase subunit F